VTLIGVGTPDPFVGEVATVRTNIDPADLAAGLKSDDNFTVAGVFDLALPDSPRELYGIRMADRLVGGPGTPPDQLGDDVIELVVRKGLDGVVRVFLRELDFVADTTTNIQAIALNPPPGADQIRLRLDHSTSDVGALHASFEYLFGGLVVGSQAFTQVARIFGTETPGNPADDENWTRAQIVAYAPEKSDSLLQGEYGTLAVTQAGDWAYTLDNSRAVTQNLSAGETATDVFTVKVADEHGAPDTETVTITVHGTNDDPVVLTGPVSRSIQEDSTPTLTETGLVAFTDVDNLDTHTTGAALVSATLSDGGTIPPAAAALLGGALTTSLIDTTAGDHSGQLRWDFALDNAAVQFLSEGQSMALRYDVAVTDNHGTSDTQNVTITITGTNDAPEFGAADDVYSFGPVNEQQGAGVIVGTVTATDVDASDVVRYSITSGNASGLFSIDELTGQIATTGSLDFETTASYALSVEARDRATGGLSDTATVNVSVGDVAELPSPSSLDVLVLYADSGIGGWLAGLQGQGFHSVDTMSLLSTTPSLANLTPYDSVLVFTNFSPSNPSALGNTLADYVDGGGGVVLATYAMSQPWAVSGRIVTDGYSPLEVTSNLTTPTGNIVPTDPSNAVFDNIDFSQINQQFFRNGNYANAPVDVGAHVLATDGAGHNMMAINGNESVVAINMFPAFESSTEQEIWHLYANSLSTVTDWNL